ncbi:MAG: DUF4832 domain-containing protein [Cyclobacteriaceae bacterium]
MKTSIIKNISLIVIVLSTALVSCKEGSPSPKNDENDSTSTVSKTVLYTESTESFFNPERGFTHLSSVFSEGSPLSSSYLSGLKSDNISIIWRLYYFEDFKNSDLSAAQLDLIEQDMTTLRNTGLKCVLRFAYTNNGDDGTDAPIDVVEGHLDQLKPIFQENADVIAFVNAGFVGLWGEWHSSTNNLTAIDNAKRIVSKLLEVLPPQIKIQLRTPKQKRDVFETSTALDDEMGYTYEDIARVGHHNDCFMASSNDYGTYENPTTDKNYISQEAFYVPTGGETCPPSGIDPADCETARETMSLLKWTYLNLDWYKPIIDGWKSEGCFEEFEQDMGYRLALRSSTMDTVISQPELLEVNIELENVGWAPIYNEKITSLVVKTLSGETEAEFELDLDIRRAKPSETFVIDSELDISNLAPGFYNLYLKISDQFESISDRADYNIRLANENVWDNNTGWNDLFQTIEVSE